MVVTVEGKLKAGRLEHPMKAWVPMERSMLFILTVARLVQ
jgi:hypothetical protein